MSRMNIRPSHIELWISARETENWARQWPCSTLRGKRVFAAFDSNGLCDLTINGREIDCDAQELNAICADMLRSRMSSDHPLHFVCVGQFD